MKKRVTVLLIGFTLIFNFTFLIFNFSQAWAGVCTDTYCHGNVPGLTASSQTFSGYVNPVSTNPATGKCGTCHRTGKFTDLTTPARYTNGTAFTISTAPAGGSHYQHASTTTYNYSCKLCHNATLTNWKGNYTVGLSTSRHIVNRATDIQFSTHNLTRPSYAVPTSTPLYFGVNAYQAVYSTSPPDTIYGRCDNLYCHGVFAGSGYTANIATWGASVTGQCGTCHATAKYAANKTIVSQSTAPKGGSHFKHVSTTTYNYDCRLCHAESISWSGTVSSYSAHVDYWTEIRFSTDTKTRERLGLIPRYYNVDAYNTFYSTSPPRGTYTDAKCANLYCHGAINDLYVARRATPTWNVPDDGRCGTCHDASMYDLSSATAPIGWKHFKHASSGPVTGAYSYQCRYCHENTVTWAGTIAFATWTHVQGSVDIKFSTYTLTRGTSATAGLYRGTTYYVDVTTNPPYNNSYCNNIYCHSDGKMSPTYRVVYSTHTVGCSSCHDNDGPYTTLTSTHGIHVSTWSVPGKPPYDYACETCHKDTVTGKTTVKNYTLHVSSTANVSFATSTAVGYNRTFDKNAWARYTVFVSSGSCVDTYCHGDGTALKTALRPSSTIYWGR